MLTSDQRELMSNRIWTNLKKGTAPKGLCWLNTHRVVINPDYLELLKAVNLDSIEGVLFHQKYPIHSIFPQALEV